MRFKYLFFLFLLLQLMVACAMAQDIAGNGTRVIVNKGKIIDTSDSKAFSSSSITINLKNHSDKSTLVLHQGTGSDSSLKLRGWIIKYKRADSDFSDEFSKLKSFDSIAPMPEEEFIVNDNGITIDEQASDSQRVIIEITVPVDKNINIYTDEELRHSGQLKNNLVLQGRNISAPAAEVKLNDLIWKTMFQPMDRRYRVQNMQAGAIIAPPSGAANSAFTVSWETLKIQATESPTVSFELSDNQQAGCADCLFALLKLTIDTAGNISKIEYVTGNKELSQIAIETLSRWKFRPLRIKGNPIITSSFVPVRVQQGKLVFEEKSAN